MSLALIPLVLISIGFFAHDPVSIFASSVLLAGALAAVLVRGRGVWKKSWFLWLPTQIEIRNQPVQRRGERMKATLL